MSDIRKWDDLSEAEQDFENYFDFYKSVHGIKPRWLTVADFQNPEEVKKMFEALEAQAVVVEQAEAEQEQAGIAEFEKTVQQTIEAGAKDRATALRWIFEAHADQNIDVGYFCYLNNIPYNYFVKDGFQ